ncbi:MAG: flagellar motor protein MotB [Pseudomonadota bacterium]
MARKKKAHGGGHGWFVTFADLMGLLLAFFVVLVAFSSQDKAQMSLMAGSMRDAFGVQMDRRLNGVVEIDGVPIKDYFKNLSKELKNDDVAFSAKDSNLQSEQGPAYSTHETSRSPRETVTEKMNFSSAAATLRQAWQTLPEVTALASSIMLEETDDGLLISLIDQEGRSMFPEGSKYPYERTRAALRALGPVLKKLPSPIAITGHTTGVPLAGRPGYTNWELSSDRANAVRTILAESGVPQSQIFGVSGKSDSELLLPNEPRAASNSRVTILLMNQAPPVPPGYRP